MFLLAIFISTSSSLVILCQIGECNGLSPAGPRRSAGRVPPGESQHLCSPDQRGHSQGSAQGGRQGPHRALQGMATPYLVCDGAPSKTTQGLDPTPSTPARHTCLYRGMDMLSPLSLFFPSLPSLSSPSHFSPTLSSLPSLCLLSPYCQKIIVFQI